MAKEPNPSPSSRALRESASRPLHGVADGEERSPSSSDAGGELLDRIVGVADGEERSPSSRALREGGSPKPAVAVKPPPPPPPPPKKPD